MAFQVEDGSGLTNSNSYSSVLEFKDHHTDRGTFAVGDFSDTEIQVGLVNGSDYIDKRFGRVMRGFRRKRQQAMEFPRTDAYDDDGYALDPVPAQLKKGANEYAWIAMKLARNLAPIPGLDYGTIDPETGDTSTEGSGFVTAKSETVGPIEESTSYESGSSSVVSTGSSIVSRIPQYPQADLWIEELLETGSHEVARG